MGERSLDAATHSHLHIVLCRGYNWSLSGRDDSQSPNEIKSLRESIRCVRYCDISLSNFCQFQFSALTFAFFGSFALILMPRSLYVLMLARVLIGFAHGYAYLSAMVHASEIMTQKLRGLAIAALNFCVVSSVFLCGTLTMVADHEKHAFGSMQWMGIVGIIYCVIGFVFVPIFTRESPVTLIRQKRFDQAVEMMVKLRNESSETWSIKNEYNELKAMVEEDEETSMNIFHRQNLRPLLLITLLKIGSVLAFNYSVNVIRLKYATMFVGEDDVSFAVITLMGVRMAGCMITLFTIDAKGRRPHFLISFGGSSIIMIVMGIVIAFNSAAEVGWVIGLLQLCFEFIGGLGIGMISDVYAAEAFNTIRKPEAIGFTTAVEFIFHAIIIAVTFDVSPSAKFNWIFLVGSGLLILAITVFLHKELPETAKMSIRQTRTEFAKNGEIVFSGSKMPAQSITFS